MKALILILAISLAACSSTKNKPADNIDQNGSDSGVVVNKIPACINNLISQFQQDKVQNPPRKVFSYTYQGKTVYYVPAICCDFFSDLYDSDCKLIGHPDGGFTGKGDGKLPDFETAKSNEVLLWQDKRK